jgi:hypothetical protein
MGTGTLGAGMAGGVGGAICGIGGTISCARFIFAPPILWVAESGAVWFAANGVAARNSIPMLGKISVSQVASKYARMRGSHGTSSINKIHIQSI